MLKAEDSRMFYGFILTVITSHGEDEDTDRYIEKLEDFEEGAFPHRFRVLDDDKNVYAEGYNSEEDFKPLDDFCGVNWGCVRIEYYKDNDWRVL